MCKKKDNQKKTDKDEAATVKLIEKLILETT